VVLAFFALISVSLAAVIYQPIYDTILTGVGEIARDGHSKIVHHGLVNDPIVKYDQILQPQITIFDLLRR